MDKLEAIERIVYADGVGSFTKLAGIRRILESGEDSADSIAAAFSAPKKECPVYCHRLCCTISDGTRQPELCSY